LTYAARCSGRDQPAMRARNGEFAGTRGRAAPLTALELTLDGPHADNYELRCEALFLGANVMVRSGRSVVLAGPSGREPLVGLKFSIETRTADAVAAPHSRAARVRAPVQIYRPQATPLQRGAQTRM